MTISAAAFSGAPFGAPADPRTTCNGTSLALILKGAPLAARMRAQIADSLVELERRTGRTPVLATILIGRNPSAEAYRHSIERTLTKVGIAHDPRDLEETIAPRRFVAELRDLGEDPHITGILVLMPLPAQLTLQMVHEHLPPLKDVDGITPTNSGRLHLGLPSLHPSTPQGGIELLEHYGIEIAGRRAVVIGRSNVVGRPMAALLLQRHATVTICHRRTVDLPSVVWEAEIVAVAAGCPGLVTRELVRPGTVVVDFGVNVVDGRIVGDADFDGLLSTAGAITPTPGGTGPVTALVLARNTIAAGFARLAGSLDEVALPLLGDALEVGG